MPDALSRLFSPDSKAKTCSPILSPSCFVEAVTWDIEQKVMEANRESRIPDGAPPDRLFVPPNTMILTVVDRFSKMVHFIPLPKLLSAKGTAEMVLHHIFHLHGFTRDIQSDRGPQFMAKFWKVFCSLLGATVSLSAGHHPQTNGQAERLNQEVARRCGCLPETSP